MTSDCNKWSDDFVTMKKINIFHCDEREVEARATLSCKIIITNDNGMLIKRIDEN